MQNACLEYEIYTSPDSSFCHLVKVIETVGSTALFCCDQAQHRFSATRYPERQLGLGSNSSHHLFGGSGKSSSHNKYSAHLPHSRPKSADSVTVTTRHTLSSCSLFGSASTRTRKLLCDTASVDLGPRTHSRPVSVPLLFCFLSTSLLLCLPRKNRQL